MKYENFNKCKELVEKIYDLKTTFDSLSLPTVTVIINASEQHGRIMTIGADPKHYEHDYSKLAFEFIEKIKYDLHYQITTLHVELGKL